MSKKHSEHHGSMNYDEKERLMITHYFGLLAENSFTEYDILGFLMVLRQELDSEKYKATPHKWQDSHRRTCIL